MALKKIGISKQEVIDEANRIPAEKENEVLRLIGNNHGTKVKIREISELTGLTTRQIRLINRVWSRRW